VEGTSSVLLRLENLFQKSHLEDPPCFGPITETSKDFSKDAFEKFLIAFWDYLKPFVVILLKFFYQYFAKEWNLLAENYFLHVFISFANCLNLFCLFRFTFYGYAHLTDTLSGS